VKEGPRLKLLQTVLLLPAAGLTGYVYEVTLTAVSGRQQHERADTNLYNWISTERDEHHCST
jgi:hypothetical protein